MRIQSMLTTGLRTVGLMILSAVVGLPAQAGTLGFIYNFSDFVETKPPTVVGTTLFLDGIATGGSISSTDPALNAAWNPVTFQDDCKADLTTGLLTGTFSMTFANNDTIFGNVFEDVSAVLATFTGPYSGTLSITGGTGNLTGSTGSASIAGIVGTTSSTALGSGTLSGPGVAPEPGSLALFGTGLTSLYVYRKKIVLSSK